MGAATALTEVADGVHRIDHAWTNCYLVDDDDGRLLLVDSGLPAHWEHIGRAVRALGRRPADVAGLVLTHAHFDHTGNAARARDVLGLTLWAHEADHEIAAHPYRYAHENPRAAYPIRHPRAAPVAAAIVRAGALRVRGVTGLLPLTDGETLDLPGSPRVVFTPGHTFGHCALHLAERDVLITGDALVTFDPYTAGRGPQIIAGAATADSAQALESLDRLVETGASTLLPGHGEPWTGGVVEAVVRAREVGAH